MLMGGGGVFVGGGVKSCLFEMAVYFSTLSGCSR